MGLIIKRKNLVYFKSKRFVIFRRNVFFKIFHNVTRGLLISTDLQIYLPDKNVTEITLFKPFSNAHIINAKQL